MPHDAFISYSHATDAKLAAALESGLEKFAKPALKLRSMDIFRDQTSLSANPSLWTSLVEHLSGSRWFLLFACPDSAASPWCLKEILWWLENRDPDKIHIILTGGEICWDSNAGDFEWTKTTALSAALKRYFREEPLFVDLRWARVQERLTLNDGRFRSAVLDLAAPIRGIAKDQLDGDDVRQLRRNKLFVRLGITAIVLAAAVAIVQAVEAVRERDLALSRQLAAQSDNLRVSEPALSLMLAAQGFAAAQSTEASTSLLRALKAAPFERMIEGSEAFWSLALSANGRSAVIGDGAAATHLVDLADGRATAVLPPQPPAILRATLAAAVSADGRLIASGGFDQTVSVWNAPGVIAKFSPGADAHEGFVLGLAFSPDARVLASAGSDGRVLLHDLTVRKTTALKKSSTPEMSVVRFSPDGKRIAAGGDGGTIVLYSLPDGRAAMLEQKLSAASVQDLSFTKDGAELVCAFLDGWLGIFHVESAKLIGSLDVREFRRLESMAAARDGNRIATGHSDGAVILWDKNGGQWRERLLYRHSAEVKAVAFTADESRLVTIGFDGRLVLTKLLDLPILTREIWRHREPFERASVAGDTEQVWIQTGTSLTKVSAKTGAILPGTAPVAQAPAPRSTTITAHAGAMATHAKRRAVRGANGEIFVESVDERSTRFALSELDAKTITAAVFSPDGRTVYTLGANEITAWDAETGRRRGDKLRLDTGLLPQLSISRDGRRLAIALGAKIDMGATGRREKAARLMLLNDGLAALADNLESIGDVSNSIEHVPMFSADGTLLTLRTNAGINVWDIDRIERIDEAVPLQPAHQVAGFTGHSRRLLIAVPKQGAMLELDVSPLEWAREACRIAGRSLTEKEWSRYVSRELSYAPACTEGQWAPGSSPGTRLKTALVLGQEWLKGSLGLR